MWRADRSPEAAPALLAALTQNHVRPDECSPDELEGLGVEATVFIRQREQRVAEAGDRAAAAILAYGTIRPGGYWEWRQNLLESCRALERLGTPLPGPQALAVAKAFIRRPWYSERISQDSFRFIEPVRGRVAPLLTAAVPELGDPIKAGEEAALLLLKEMGPGAVDAVPAICVFLCTPADDEKVKQRRALAFDALAAMGPAAKDAVPTLAELLKQPIVHDVRRGKYPWDRACWALGQIGPEASAAVPALKRVFNRRHDRHDARWGLRSPELAAVFGQIGPGARDAVPLLVEALIDDDWAMRVQAALALWRIERHPSAIAVLVDALTEATAPSIDPLVSIFPPRDAELARLAAIRALREIGPEARSALPALRALKAKYPSARYAHSRYSEDTFLSPILDVGMEVEQTLAVVDAAPWVTASPGGSGRTAAAAGSPAGASP